MSGSVGWGQASLDRIYRVIQQAQGEPEPQLPPPPPKPVITTTTLKVYRALMQLGAHDGAVELGRLEIAKEAGIECGPALYRAIDALERLGHIKVVRSAKRVGVARYKI